MNDGSATGQASASTGLARRESWAIYVGLAVAGAGCVLLVAGLTRTGAMRSAHGPADTRYGFVYRDPTTVIRDTDRIIMDAAVLVAVAAHADRPATITIAPASAARTAGGAVEGLFTWTITPELGSHGPTQLAGEVAFGGVTYRLCEAIIGSAQNFPPSINRLYAEQYFPLGNAEADAQYRTPRSVDPAPFVDFMRTAIADTASFTGDGGLPTHRLRELAGRLIASCTAGAQSGDAG